MIKFVFDCTATFKGSLGYARHCPKVFFNSFLYSWLQACSLTVHCMTVCILGIVALYPYRLIVLSLSPHSHFPARSPCFCCRFSLSSSSDWFCSDWFPGLESLSTVFFPNLQLGNSLPFQIFSMGLSWQVLTTPICLTSYSPPPNSSRSALHVSKYP